MNRILFSAMEKREGKYIYKNKIFSGLGFSVDSQEKVSAFVVKEGVILNSYHSICAPDNQEYMQVNLTGQLSDYVLPEYFGKPYSGIGYEFTGDICDREIFLKNGVTYSEVHWDKNGEMMYFDVPNESFGEVYEWYPGGILKTIKISTNDKFSGAINFSEDGKLNYLSSRGGLLENLEYIYNKAKFFPFKKISDIEKLEGSKEVSFFGEDVSSEFLCHIISAGVLANTLALRLVNTDIKNFNLKKIPLLQKINIDNEKIKKEDIDVFKNAFYQNYLEVNNVDLSIFLNGVKIL
ncbi:hypothetical protein ACIPF8_00045 [Collimonas sp. NPDC087041]|uniref:hypothetical protein n=1 Tax=Collimonas sp. NPDC087041 TaxID=3363960 RepID=UPI003823C396